MARFKGEGGFYQYGCSLNAVVSSQRRFDRRFYLGWSLVFLALVFFAFLKSYYLKGFFGTPALSTLVHIHGVVMSGWVVLLVVQSALIATHRVQWHRRLGAFGAAWAALVVILGTTATLHAAAREVRAHTELASIQVTILGLELVQMLMFAGFVVAAVWLRRRGDFHKRLMFLTIICMLPSAVARLPIGMQSNQVILLYVDLFLLVCVGIDTIRRRRLHPAFAWGASLVLLALNAAYFASQAPWWISLGSRLVS
jgi:hypothetical protein